MVTIEKENPRALEAFEQSIRNDPVLGLIADHCLVKLESHEPTNPEFLDRSIDTRWQQFLSGWKAHHAELDELTMESQVIEQKNDTEMLNWLLGRLHIARNTPTQDIWEVVSFSAPHWDCVKDGSHDMRAIITQAMK